MTDRFEKVGIDYQLNCKNIHECDSMLRYSCNCCQRLSRFMWHECEKCPIQMTHDELVAYFSDEKRRNSLKLKKGGDKHGRV